MTDADRFLKLMADFDVEPVVEAHENSAVAYVLESGNGGVRGDSRLSCEFRFDADGKFRDVGLWE